MSLRHAAALALVGWYLMMPPLESHWWDRVSYQLGWIKEVPAWAAKEEPLSEWDIYKSFDSADECAHAKDQNFVRSLENSSKTAYLKAVFDRSVAAQCISTDDPRLK